MKTSDIKVGQTYAYHRGRNLDGVDGDKVVVVGIGEFGLPKRLARADESKVAEVRASLGVDNPIYFHVLDENATIAIRPVDHRGRMGYATLLVAPRHIRAPWEG